MQNYARSLLPVYSRLSNFQQKIVYLLLTLIILGPLKSAAQKPEDAKVNVDFNNIPLKQAFKEIEKKSKLKFVYNEESVAPYHATLKAQNETVKQVLVALLKNTRLEFQFKESKCIIVDKKSVSSTKMGGVVTPPTQVPMSSIMMRSIHGKVTASDDNLPLSNATIMVKEFVPIRTQTNNSGQFTISFPANAKTLVITHIGYAQQEILISDADSYEVMMDVSKQSLNDVVVVGPFTRKAESFTGAAVTFTQEDLRSVGDQNIIQSLKILDPSFIQIENNSMGSDPNTLPNLQIRGGSSLPGLQGSYSSEPNMPLFILDGFEASEQKIYDLDMNRVASVTILKDAAAKAIYGSKAANGVVVVETRRPQAGKLQISYTADVNVTAPDLSSYHLANASQKLQIEQNAGRYTTPYFYSTQLLAEQYNRTYTDVVRGVNTDWLAQPVHTGLGQKHALSMEGGDAAFRYGVDMSYNKITGAMKGSNRNTTLGDVYLSYRVKNVLFRNTLTVGFNRSDDSPYGSFSQYSRLNPYWSPKDSTGSVSKLLGTFDAGLGTPISYYNPLYDATIGTKNFSRYTDINDNFQIEWSVAKSLKLITRFSYDQQQNHREDFYPAGSTRYANYPDSLYFQRGDYSISDGRDISIRSDVTLNYSKQLKKHLLFLNVGWNISDVKSETYSFSAQGFLNDQVDNISFAKQYPSDSRPTGSDAVTRETGIISALNYSYDDRFLLDMSYRKQGSSIFGADNKWGDFGSKGIGWNLHNETFLRKVTWINQLRLRASTGYTGSQNFNPYQAMATYNFYTDTYYDNVVGAKLMALANNQLKWQETREHNYAVDIKLFNRMSLRFDYYIKNTDNLLTDISLPGSTGFFTIVDNLGAVQNKGIDATLSFKVLSNPEKGSFLNLFVSAASNKNKLVKISNALKNLNDQREAARASSGSTAPFIRYQEGQSTSAIFAVRSLGIDPANGKEIYLKADGTKTYLWNADDQVALGDSNPKVSGSFGFNTVYKGWGLNCAFSYKVGGQYYNQTLADRVENVDIQYNVDSRVFTDTWKKPGDQSFFKNITSRPNKSEPTSRFVQNLNQLVMSSINASYDFKNAALLKKLGLKRFKATMFTNDLFTVSSIQTERGLDYPYARSLSFSLQATF
ncbi:SusC/RagA family TonB-linked outer membrane protein [Mucilaginibacter paludis]|uniref:TonB-dependent receptor plug n=1 Tax=Mucilaginibacter paludis DSM 18603 TaxID=714943 RepID=H1Y4U3_9SPHI|nr:SusC/RagA family TonB-linked outer membrane protein [Mucilaginibacter paludis]EHQ28137.1 TonB-dependent receptor plug [Mucilaginibacter paludis DSM 18603]